MVFEDEALVAITKQAIARNTGARGLRSILEAILLETMFELPSYKNIEEVIITKDVVEQKTKPIIKYSQKKNSIA